jgi:hypothetical protein
MEVKSLFDTAVKQDIIERINKLTPQSQPLWGKMNVGQMLAHLQMPIGVAIGSHKLKRTLFGRIVGPLAKPIIYNDRPFKKHLPTDRSFIMIGIEKEFESEKAKLLNMINHFSQNTMVDEPHPFFGKMTKDQWSIGSWKHIDHHLQQFGV